MNVSFDVVEVTLLLKKYNESVSFKLSDGIWFDTLVSEGLGLDIVEYIYTNATREVPLKCSIISMENGLIWEGNLPVPMSVKNSIKLRRRK